MSKDPIYKKYSNIFDYKTMSNWNPLKAPTIWANTNAMLDDYYKLPDVNIQDDKIGKNLKNSMRHIVGPAIMTQEYNEPFTRYMGGLKEARDLYAQQDTEDQFIDLRNNQIGIDYANNNPSATNKDIMDFARKEAIKNYNRDYNYKNLYDLLMRDFQ